MTNFRIIDTEHIYRRLLAEDDPAARVDYFRRELAAPFTGVVRVFGMGDDVVRAFSQWNMSPEMFAPQHRAHMTAVLDTLAQADAWNRAERSLLRARDAFSAYAARLNLPEVVFALCLADLSNMPKEAHNYTGFGGIPGYIMTVYGEPDAYNLKRVEAATVHEFHHNVAAVSGVQNLQVMTATLGQYMIFEGLAESFSGELYGADCVGPWVAEFDESLLESTKALFRPVLTMTGFNEVRGYIFGNGVMGSNNKVPMYAGYALGYRVVQAYIKRTGKTVVESTFVAPETIIADSGFFD